MPQNKVTPSLTKVAHRSDALSFSKEEWRTFARQSRAALFAQPEHFALLCQRVQHNLLESALWQESTRVLLYVSFHDEVDTHLLLRTAWEQKKHVYLPRCEPGKRGEMTMHRCGGLSELVPSPMGILEPTANAPCFAPDGEAGTILVVVPGLVFDTHGYRIGYGGGYYDRLLAHGTLRSVGLALAQNLVPMLPHETWDVAVGAVCTEDGIM